MTTMRWTALVSTMLVLPLVILESMHTTLTRQNAFGLFLLFGVLWLLPTVFLAVLASIVRAWTALTSQPVRLLFRLATVVVLAFVWSSLLIDQMPCFLGVPNCD